MHTVMKNRTGLLLSLLFLWVCVASAQGIRYANEIFSSHQLQSNIQYGTTSTMKFDFYTGTGDLGTHRPLVIFIHGGGFKSGDKVSSFGTLVCGGLARRGYAVASINYRLTTTIPDDTVHFEAMMKALQDSKSAIRYFRSNPALYGIDTSQIFVTGSSAGSITALHLAFLDSSEVPSRIWERGNIGTTFEGSSGNAGYSSRVQGVISNWGAIGDTAWMGAGDVPVYCVHGTADSTVYYNLIPADGPFLHSSKYVYQRAQNVGLQSVLRPFINTGHTLDNNTTKQDSAYREFSAWLYTILRNPAVGSAAKLAFAVQPSNALAGNILTPAITVQIQDSLGNLITSETRSVTIAIGTNPGGGTLSGTLTVAAVGGVATFNDLSISAPGVGYTLQATSGVLTGATSTSFNILPGGSTGTIITTGSGNWSSTVADAPWPGGIIPSLSDNVVIADGHSVTIDVAAVCANLTVGQGTSGQLQFEATTARTLSVTGDVTIRPGAVFQTSSSGAVTSQALTLGGNLINNGILDFSTNGNTAGASITFTGSANAEFSGTGTLTNIRALTVNKGTSPSTILTLNPSSFKVLSDTSNVAGFLTLTNGILKIAGTFPMTNRLFTVAAYSIPATAGIWLDNPAFTVAGQSANCINDGLLRISNGTYNIGAVSSNKMTPTTGSTTAVFIFEGGTTNISGMLRSGSSTTIALTVTGGTINVTTVGASGNAEPGFGFTSTANTVTMTGGTINLVNRDKYSTTNLRRDYNVVGGIVNVTGGMLNVGTDATPAGGDSSTFMIAGVIPNLTIYKRVAKLSGAADVYGDITIGTGDTLDVNTKDGISIIGNATMIGNLTNNGVILGAAGSRLKFAGTNGRQLYDGTGIFGSSAAPFDGITVNNPDGAALHNTIITNRVNLYQGAVQYANFVTLGNGGTSTATIQVGNSSSVQAGLFEGTPNFQVGSGGLNILYGGSLGVVTTGSEIPPSRSLNKISIGNANGVRLAGGGLSIDSLLTLSSGNLFTHPDTVSLGIAGTMTGGGATSHVIGALRKSIPVGAVSRVFEIGDSLQYTPVTATFGNVSVSGTLTAASYPGTHPQFASSGLNSSKKVNRYFSLTRATTSFDTCAVKFEFAESDKDPGADTARFVVKRYSAGTWSAPQTVAPRSTSIQAGALTALGDFAIGEPGAASIGISPASVNFGSVPVTSTIFDTVTVRNTGAVTLMIDSARVTGSAFSVSPTGSVSILTGDSTRYVVGFHPVAAGMHTGTVIFSSNAPSMHDSLHLTGAGVEAHFTLSPGSLSFGTVFVSSSRTDSVLVSNIGGSAPLVISAITSGMPAEFTVLDGTPIQLAPGATAWIRIAFHPGSTGLHQDWIVFQHNASSSPDSLHVDGTGFLSVSVTVNVLSGWNMIANPVTATNDSVRALYPSSLNAYAFAFAPGSGYAQDYTMENGRGYWEKFPAATSHSLSGLPRTRDSIAVVAGWNMVGTITGNVDTAAITSIPSGIRASNWFGYAGGYAPAATLVAGQAYWIKANAAGKFVLANGPVVAKPSTGKGVADVLNSVTITDAAGNAQTLYFGADVNNDIAAAQFVMPPLPPSGAFDARFSTSDGGAMVQTHPAKSNGPVEYPISIQTEAYPVTVSWHVAKGTATYQLTDGASGRRFLPKQMMGEGTLQIRSGADSHISIRLMGDGSIPSRFVLDQNYPNPFNPATTIQFGLPVQSRVTLALFNVIGQRVRTLVSDDMAAGYHTAEWNGTDDNGRHVASGVYFLRLAATGVNGTKFSEGRNLLLIK
jgi:hypothetical protein